MFQRFRAVEDDQGYMWYELIDSEFTAQIYCIPVEDYYHKYSEIINLGHGKDSLVDFFDAIYRAYKDREKNPTPNMIRFVNMYYYNRELSQPTVEIFKEFMKSKNIDYEKYMVLL